MYILYYDESGDDGYPRYSSPIFVLSVLYLHHTQWQDIFNSIKLFREDLKSDFGIPSKLEMHTRPFLLNKKPYHSMGLTKEDRIEIVRRYCNLIGNLDVKIINVVVVKPRITSSSYKVLDRALTFSIQRIENDIAYRHNDKYLIITDPGRVGKMRKISRRMQRINLIPSRGGESFYRREIGALIEDPLPKNSKESHFIQLVDVTAFVVYLHSIIYLEINNGMISRRLSRFVTQSIITDWMNMLSKSFNLQATQTNEYGIFYHPYN